MGVIDLVQVGGTTYDVQDARVAPLDGRVNALHNLVNYGYDIRGYTNGILKSRIGTTVVIDGRTGGTVSTKVLLSGAPYVYQGGTWPSELTTGITLTVGHKYRLRCIEISGTRGGSVAPRFYSVGTFSYPSSQINSDTDSIITYNETDYPNGGFVALAVKNGKDYSNYTVQVIVEDITDAGGIAVSGVTPSITAEPNSRYVCTAAYVESLSITPAAYGICSVRFTSGTTPTVLTLPQTVVMPDWWNGVEASRTYEISIEDGVYGVVTSWT